VVGELLLPVVLVPGYLAVSRGQHIHVPVSIQVGSKQRTRSVGCAHNVIREPFVDPHTACVFVPPDVGCFGGGGKHVHVSVSVQIHRIDGASTGAKVADGLGGPGLVAVVLVPGDSAVAGRSRQHVDVSVSVHVDGKHGVGTKCRRADGVCSEGLVAVVLVPGDRAVVELCSQHVHISVSI